MRDWREGRDRQDVDEKLKIGNHLARHAFPASLACLAAASLGLAACGYQFRVEGAGPTIGRGAATPVANAPTLKVVNFENFTFTPNIELKYTTYAHREFSEGSGARVVNDGEPAELIFKGKINSISQPTINFSLQGTFEGRVTVNVSATVEEAKTGRIIWNQAVAASSEYFLTDDLQFNKVLEMRAIEQAGRLVAQDLATRFQNFLDLRAKPDAAPPASGAAPGVPTNGASATGTPAPK